ncbi:MAG: 16S rRNA processing protein RimM [Lachnospiraceae bacterium]|nr:16S rRNA processing protein RimM [Lachnospiraceae bacterium]
MKEDLLKVGVITSPHGVHGEVKVFPTTDDVKRFKKLKKCYLDIKGELKETKVVSFKFLKNMAILKFEGFENRDMVEGLRQIDIMIDRADAVPLLEDEFFITDVIESEVFDEEDNKLGVITEVLTSAANDVFVVKKSDGRELLIPVIKQCIVNIDNDVKRVTVHLLDGMDE